MRIIVCGSRTWIDKARLEKKLAALTAKLKHFEIVTGACSTGADKLAEDWALRNGITIIRYHADWKKHDKAAGPIRNSEMVKESGATVCLAFRCNGKSSGTDDCIAKARRAKLKVVVIKEK